MSTGALVVDNEQALSWLDEELEYARNRGKEKLAALLGVVRNEIVFEMSLDPLLVENRYS